MNINIHEHIATAAGVTITAAPENLVTVKGPKGEVKRSFFDPKIQITGADGGLDLKSQRATRKEKTRLYSYAAHIKNMIQGVQIPHEYKMKVCSGHFPINVAISGSALSVKNFLGEKNPTHHNSACGRNCQSGRGQDNDQQPRHRTRRSDSIVI